MTKNKAAQHAKFDVRKSVYNGTWQVDLKTTTCKDPSTWHGMAGWMVTLTTPAASRLAAARWRGRMRSSDQRRIHRSRCIHRSGLLTPPSLPGCRAPLTPTFPPTSTLCSLLLPVAALVSDPAPVGGSA